MRLRNVHALVTGGGSGIGAAIARTLAAEGARLTLVGRRRETLRTIADTLTDAHVAPADVTDRSAIEEAFASARAKHGPIGILVNNAGAATSSPFAGISADEWRGAIAVNLDALFHCCQAALPDLLAVPSGRIVTVASTAGVKGYSYTAHYAAAKHGAIGLTRSLAIEFAGTSLTVNTVCPGFTDTEIVRQAVAKIATKTGRDEQNALRELTKFNPQKRLIDPIEVADAVLWLCLPTNRSITGQAVMVAGGEVM